METGIIILAAGKSSRLGRPKQLLSYKGKTLLQNVIDGALKTSCSPIVVVLGANSDEILEQHNNKNIHFIVNPLWENGMASSIVAGLSAVVNLDPYPANIIIAVADQAFITELTFNNLIEKKKSTGKGIIASAYQQTLGTPVLFTKDYFEALLSLEGSSGAKKIVKQYPADVESVAFELGYVDIDTETDYINLING
ncbi:nucleotidyltransferase family protein [Pedobacter sp. GSP4]|uniref:nucleotidyltransferase family protein n=1 Tax=Pedobacter sp. GSP4 TaxID=3453716 RepID=UPI003EE9F4F8